MWLKSDTDNDPNDNDELRGLNAHLLLKCHYETQYYQYPAMTNSLTLENQDKKQNLPLPYLGHLLLKAEVRLKS
jgi:hypothetical protein